MCPSHCCVTQDRKKTCHRKGFRLTNCQQNCTIELNVNVKYEFKIPPGSGKSSFFWVITQQVVVITYRTFRTTNWSHLQDDTNWLFCHRNMLLSVTRSDINFSTVLRAGQLQNRELRVICGVCLGGYLSLQNVSHETWHIRVYLVCVCVCVCVCMCVCVCVRVRLNEVPVYQTNIQSVLNVQHAFYHSSCFSLSYNLAHFATNHHCSIAPAIPIDCVLPSL